MASLNVSCVPRNPELLWAQTRSGHRSYPLFTDGFDEKLKVRRCDYEFSKTLAGEDVSDNLMHYIESAGFKGVLQVAHQQVDHGLIKALVERWRPETNTFHFPTGEATVTLEDVQVIWGLPVDGPVVSGTWFRDTSNIARWNMLCESALGFLPDDEGELRSGKLKMTSIVHEITMPFNEDDEEACQKRARTIIMGFFGTQMFADSNTRLQSELLAKY